MFVWGIYPVPYDPQMVQDAAASGDFALRLMAAAAALWVVAAVLKRWGR